jgi:hypothetical protein
MDSMTKPPRWFVLTLDWLGPIGVALVTIDVISRMFVPPLRIGGQANHPYVGIVIFLILSGLFFTHLLAIPIGSYAGKHRIRKGFKESAFDRKALDRLAWFCGVTTLVNVPVGTHFNDRAIKLMETPQFRGQACYSLNPEFAPYLNSACSGRQRADSREARKHKLLKEVSTPRPSAGAF